MSIAPHESEGLPDAPARWRLVLRVLAVVASIGAIAALWIGERQKANYDLQLIVQPAAAPGATIALRALLLGGMEAVEGPRLTPTTVQVALRDEAGRELAHSELRPDALDGMGGELQVPRVEPGRYVLDATARLDAGAPARCRMSFRIDPAGGALEPRGRVAGPLQHLSPGPLRPRAEPVPALALSPRVPGGTCIPEQPCELWVRMGAEAALELEPTASVSLASQPEPPGATPGLVRVSVVVHGPEAETTLRARRGDEVLAERALRLPVGLGEVALEVERSVIGPAERPRFRVSLPPGRSALVLDAYRQGAWRATSGFEQPPVEHFGDWPGPELEEGLWWLQARADPFSSASAGARVVFVRPPGMDDETLLRRLDREGAEASGRPVFGAAQPLPGWALADLQRTATYLLAPLEDQRLPLPAAVSGRPAQLRRLSDTRNLLRFSVGAMLLLSAFVVSATMVRRELGEQEATRNALRDAGDTSIDTPLSRRRQAFWLWSMALGVALAFVLAALLIVAKPLWF